MEFYVYETRELIKAKHRPLVFITSNNEKELPDAFLRRCFFHYIKFPDADTMKRIVDVHFPGLKKELLGAAMKTFYDVRNLPGLKKKPSHLASCSTGSSCWWPRTSRSRRCRARTRRSRCRRWWARC